jgi:L-lysine exporter family protein LysE/ArgO
MHKLHRICVKTALAAFAKPADILYPSAMELPYVTGLATGASLIIAIGAQNAFVLTQGIRKQHRLAVSLICSLCDMLLICAGVAGLGNLIERSPLLLHIAGIGGSLFLFSYGLKSLIAAFRSSEVLEQKEQQVVSLGQIVVQTLGITLLNPHVYLDTVVLLGSISVTFTGSSRYLFGAGAASMSFIWFFFLCYGSTLLAPLFKKALTWRILNAGMFVLMWSISFQLLVYTGILQCITTMFHG